MKKKSIVGRIGVVAVALTLATTSLMSGTLAKYTTSKESTAKAFVAKWQSKIYTNQTSKVWTDDIKLTDFLVDSGTVKQDTIGVAAAGDSTYAGKRIGPGSKCTIPVTIDMTGTEVDTKYIISFNTDDFANNPSNLKFSYTLGSSTKDLASVSSGWNQLAIGYLAGARTIASDNSAPQLVTLQLHVEWPFEDKTSDEASSTYNATDIEDVSRLMGAATMEMGLKLKVEAEQASGLGNDSYSEWKKTQTGT